MPQGSFLWPRLFSIFMNEISVSGYVHLYADDIKAFVIGTGRDEAIKRMQIAIHVLLLLNFVSTQWCRKRKEEWDFFATSSSSIIWNYHFALVGGCLCKRSTTQGGRLSNCSIEKVIMGWGGWLKKAISEWYNYRASRWCTTRILNSNFDKAIVLHKA